MPRCSLSYAKIVQTESRTTSLLECYAEVQLIFLSFVLKHLDHILVATNELAALVQHSGV